VRKLWSAWRTSYVPEEATAGSSPGGIALGVLALIAVLGVIGYVPAIAEHSQFARPWVSIALVLIGGGLTLFAWSRGCRGAVGGVATLLDNVAYSSALTYAAVNTRPAFGLPIAIVLALMLLAMPARVYALSWVFATALLAPLLAALLIAEPDFGVAVVLVCTYTVTLFAAWFTGRRRQTDRERAGLRAAFGAADRIADESLQAALGNTLLSIGNFLHELKNQQTVVMTNLHYLLEQAVLSESSREVVLETLDAARQEQKLVIGTLEELRSRTRPANAVFFLREVLEGWARDATGIRVTVTASSERLVVDGPPDYLRVVATNLVRNAEQAGARSLTIDVRLDESGRQAVVTVGDDGPGIPSALRAVAFTPLMSSTSPTGTGLGLYLCRRYIELLGGTIALAEPNEAGGAVFVIKVPCRASTRQNDLAPATDRAATG
jgi:signal transduction histidine kinase